MTKVAIVTGANKGIGFAIVKGLCEKFQGKIYLTARDEERGLVAVEELKKLGFHLVFHQLDITDQGSVDKFRDHVKKTDGGIDILINNAGIVYPHDSKVPVGEQAEVMMEVNYFGSLRLCEALFPLLRDNARVINLSSSAGHLSRLPSAELRSALSSPTLTVEKLNELMNQFVTDAKKGKHAEGGWPSGMFSSYSVTKMGVSALTRILQREVAKDSKRKGISVNSNHPGYVDTDLTQHRGHLTPDEGTKSTLFLALDSHNLYGQFIWSNCAVIDWCGPTMPDMFS